MIDNIIRVSIEPTSGYPLGEEAFGGIVIGSLVGSEYSYSLIASKFTEGDSGQIGDGSMFGCMSWCAEGVGDGELAYSSTNGVSNTHRVISNGGYSTINSIFEWLTRYIQGTQGYGDWYIPSCDELNVLYQNRNHLDNYVLASYWSSTEYSSINAHLQHFDSGGQYTTNKSNSSRFVRVVRRGPIDL